jgi:hypothetical protein
LSQSVTGMILPQALINKSLESAEKSMTAAPLQQGGSIRQPVRSVCSLLHSMEKLKNGERGITGGDKEQQIDTLFVGLVPNDTLNISGTYTHNGPVFILNNGVLKMHNASFTNIGDVYVFQSGRLLADSSTLFFPQQYFYQRALIAAGAGYVHLETCSLNYGGYSHNMVAADSATVEMNNIYFYDWTTAGLYGKPVVKINGANLTGEYIMTDEATAEFKNVNTLLLWHHFPDSAIINYSFPDGGNLNNFTLNNGVPGISGIGYSESVDSSQNIWWGLMPVNGSDVTISNSVIRTIGAWFERGDSVTASGLIDNSNYSNFTAPLTDRNLHLVNSSVQTWSLYVFDSSKVTIGSSILGEVGCMGHSSVTSSQFFLDGSGGYFWATDTSFLVASSVNATSHIRSERNGIFIFGYGTVSNGIASAIGNSVLIVVQSGLPQDPVPYEGGCAWFANIGQASPAFVDTTVNITGSAWIDQGPLGSFLDFGSYSMYYQPQGAPTWTNLVSGSPTEIRNNVLSAWNTYGLMSGNYLLKLVMKDNLGDSVEAIKMVTLLPTIIYVEELSKDNSIVKIFPNPVSQYSTFEFSLQQPASSYLYIYDVWGQKRETLLIPESANGIQKLRFDAAKYPKGIYFYSLSSGGNTSRGKFVVE